MNLGDVTRKTVPKMCLVAPPRAGGAICTRTFIPHRVHDSIGVLGAVSVATACVLPGSVAAQVGVVSAAGSIRQLDIEHPTGFFTVAMDVAIAGSSIEVRRSALLRTARKLMRRRGVRPGAPVERPLSDLRRICLLGFGEVGQVLAADLRAQGAERRRLGPAVLDAVERPEPRGGGRTRARARRRRRGRDRGGPRRLGGHRRAVRGRRGRCRTRAGDRRRLPRPQLGLAGHASASRRDRSRAAAAAMSKPP